MDDLLAIMRENRLVAAAMRRVATRPGAATEMTIDDIVTQLAERANVSRAVAREVLRCYHELITDRLQKNEDFEIRGIGRLRVKEAPARVGRNPQTGEQMDIPAARRVAFAPSTTLKRTMAEVAG